jgi:hypothetical protein
MTRQLTDLFRPVLAESLLDIRSHFAHTQDLGPGRDNSILRPVFVELGMSAGLALSSSKPRTSAPWPTLPLIAFPTAQHRDEQSFVPIHPFVLGGYIAPLSGSAHTASSPRETETSRAVLTIRTGRAVLLPLSLF